MAISIRHYILDDKDALRRVPKRISDALTFGHDGIPEYAGTRQRVIDVVVENESGRPVRILDARGSYWGFDKDGQIDNDLRARLPEVLEFAFDPPDKHRRGKVVDLRPELKRKEYERETRWEVTADLLDRIAADFWPDLAKAREVTAVKGKAPRRPPLSHDAREALTKIRTKAAEIDFAMYELSEVALKGFAFEARRLAAEYADERQFWEAIAAKADHKREIKAQHRTGKGVWYAVLHVWYHVDDREMRELDAVEVRCNGRPAAAAAARKLLAEHASKFDERVTVEAELMCELEWASSDEEKRATERESEASKDDPDCIVL